MSLSAFSVRRPVTVTMIFLGIILLGVISWLLLPQEFFPPITYPQLTVMTNYPNAAPEEVETLITKLIEEAVGTVKNARRITSTSREGTSIVVVEFNWGTDMNFAALGMREKIDLIKERLPREAEEPIVMKFNPFALPIMTLSISGDSPINELYEIAKRYIKDRLEKIEGVASCAISGGIEREIQVEVDSGALYNSDIDLLAVVNALQNSNLNYPAGTTKQEFFEWLVRTIGEFNTISDIDSTVVAIDEQKPSYPREQENEQLLRARRAIKLRDIAAVKDAFKERTSYSRYNGKENISISIQKQAEANTIKTVQKVLKELRKVEEILPQQVSIDVAYDQSKFIKNAIGSVRDAAYQGGLLAVLVLLFFLQNVKNALIVALSIPISIIGTFCLMYFSGISINMISFLGLAMGVGMLVDGAIVVIENVFRHSEMGEDIKKASEIGTNEMVAAVTSSVLTTIAVFLPLVFVVGTVGQMFKDLSLTITYSLLVSLVVAFSLIPMFIATRGGGGGVSHLKIFNTIEEWLKKTSDFYAGVLVNFLNNRKKGLTVIAGIFIASLFLFFFIGKEFMPRVDEGQFLVKIDMPAGTKLDITNEIAGCIERQILNMKHVKTASVTVGSNKDESSLSGSLEMLQANQAQIAVTLASKRDVTTDEFIQDLKNKLESTNLEGAELNYVLSQNVMFSAFEGTVAPVVVEIKGQDLEKLSNIATDIMDRLGKIEGVYNVKSSVEEPAPETKIVVNKNKAALYDLSVRDIARTAQIGIDGWVATKFKEEGREIDVRVRLKEKDRKDFSVIKQIRIISPNGTKVPLEEVADFKLGKGPSEIKRVDKERTALVYANVFGRNINDVIKDIAGFIENMKIPSGYTKPKLTGEREQMSESFNSLQFALILSILLIYMIMAAQFESLWQPFIIMFTVPLSVIGVALALFITRTTVNAISIFGFIILGGIVVDNGLVLIDCINALRASGKDLYNAVVEASAIRLRPILMTALTTTFGLIPLALGIGEGAELQSPLAITVIGGLTVATFLTLVVIPAIYIIWEESLAKLRQRTNSKPANTTKKAG